MKNNLKVLIVGLDGGTWNLIKDWTVNGDLPTFRKLVNEGVHGTLESTIPPLTAPAWASFSTGKNPGKHGVFDFVKMERNKLKMITSKDIKSITFYDIFSQEKLKNIIVGLPLSFPPKNNYNGVMISDFLHPRKEIRPENKIEYINDYYVWPDFKSCKTKEELLMEMEKTALNRIRTAKRLILNEEWDFFFLHYGETDWISHKFWMDIKKNSEFGQKAKRIFLIIDEFLDWYIKLMGEKSCLFIVSDHGFADCSYKFNINRFLFEKKLLNVCFKDFENLETLYPSLYRKERTESPRIKNDHKLKKIMKKCIFKFLNSIKLGGIVLKLFYIKPIKSKIGIDYENSQLFVMKDESYGLFRNSLIKRDVEETIKLLKNLENKGEKIFKEIFLKEEVYSGSNIALSPDILLIPNNYFISKDMGNPFFKRYTKKGQHDLDGILLAYGPGIKNGLEVKKVKIYDIAPTMLHIFGLTIPKDMDGNVLMDIFKDNSEFKRRAPIYKSYEYHEKLFKKEVIDIEDEERIKNRLKTLGYL